MKMAENVIAKDIYNDEAINSELRISTSSNSNHDDDNNNIQRSHSLAYHKSKILDDAIASYKNLEADINSEPIIPPTSNLPITNLLLPISIIGCLADINNEPIISPTSNANNKIKKSRRNKWKNNIARTSYKSLQEMFIFEWLADINSEPIIPPTSNANNKTKKSCRNKQKNNIARTSYKSSQGKGMKKFKKVDDNDETEVMFNIKEEDREMMMFEWLADINSEPIIPSTSNANNKTKKSPQDKQKNNIARTSYKSSQGKGMKKSKKVDDNDETEVMFNIKEEDRGKGMKKFKEADDNDETEVMFNIKEDQETMMFECLADINSESIISSTSNANNKTKKSPQNKQRNNIARTSYNSSQGIDKVEIIFEYKEDDLAECIKNNKKQKAVTEIWIWMWFVHRVWSTDKFSNLRWRKIKAMELKSIITTLLLIAFPMMAIYDISWIKIKYSEGHIGLTSTSADGHNEDKYIEKPYLDPNNSSQIIWSKENQILKETADYLLCAIYSLQTGTLILLQAFWSHLTDQMGDKTFMNSCEFKMYTLWSFLSILIFPIPRYMLEDNQLLSEVGLFGSLSLTKKTLNRLSKVIVIVSNDQSSSMTTSDDSEYYEEEDVESDNNKGAQRAR
ncbi:23471_t:CDS:10 [Entrophospora sp. SA101]|nr:23471_t:CDS:10 [Entrophospora sp. SA101]